MVRLVGLLGLSGAFTAVPLACGTPALESGSPQEQLGSVQSSAGVLIPRTADPTKTTILTFNLHRPGWNDFGVVSQATCDAAFKNPGGQNPNNCLRDTCVAGELDQCFCTPLPSGFGTQAECKAACADERIGKMAWVIAESGADVVVLQEVDRWNSASSVGAIPNPRDMIQDLADEVELHTGESWSGHFRQACADAGPVPYQSGRRGDAMLFNKATFVHDITLNGNDQLQCNSPTGVNAVDCADPDNLFQQQQAVWADVRGIRVFGVHLAYGSPASCIQLRENQIAAMAPSIPSGPHVIAGDFNQQEDFLSTYYSDYANGTDLITNSLSYQAQPWCQASKIDHIITKNIPSADFQALSFGDYNSSDHLAVALSIPQEWDKIVPVQLGSSGQRSLFFYNATGGSGGLGRGEFYQVGANSNLVFRSYHGGLRASLQDIIVGDFDGDGWVDDLLFYDAANGVGEFWEVGSAGELTSIATYNNWGSDWDILTPVRKEGDTHTGIAYYDRSGGQPGYGHLLIYRLSGEAAVSPAYSNTYWSPSWDIVVNGDFDSGSARDGLLFYDGTNRTGKFYRFNASGSSITGLMYFYTWRSTWDAIVPVLMNGGANTGLLFHDRTGSNTGTSLTQLYNTDTWTSLPTKDWDRRWSTIAAQDQTNSFPYDELFLYDRTLHHWEVYGGNLGTGSLLGASPQNPWRQGWGALLTGTASMSSLYANYYATNASDGNTSTMAHTQKEQDPWWELDLGPVQYITRVLVHQRTGCCTWRLNDFDVEWTPDCSNYAAGGSVHHSGNIPYGEVRSFSIGDNAQCVRIRSHRNDYLNLPEVEVWGRPAVDP